MRQTLKALAIACAQAGLSGEPPGRAEAEALATLDRMPAPFPDFSASLRRLAGGEMPPIPDGLPTALRDLLTEALRATRRQASTRQSFWRSAARSVMDACRRYMAAIGLN